MWMHLGMRKCCILSLGHCDLDLVYRNCIEPSASLIFFEVGIPNLLCNASWDGGV